MKMPVLTLEKEPKGRLNGGKIAIEFQNSKSEKAYCWGAKPFS